MDHNIFMCELEYIAIHNGLRLLMSRAAVGCGINFCFQHDATRKRSDAIVYFHDKETAGSLFGRLEVLAKDFKKELNL